MNSLQEQVVDLHKQLDVYKQQPTVYQDQGRRGGSPRSISHGTQQVLLGRKTRGEMAAQERRTAELELELERAKAETRAEVRGKRARDKMKDTRGISQSCMQTTHKQRVRCSLGLVSYCLCSTR